ncbi:Glycosyltransferase involved in cell wall bisynthesis [Streptomyces sp. yr375]|uniref:glycosyltransferase family protein n=1 Tax=Streptomyces sp. yr375 TaxID=1761906 RepID=UPI0008D6CF9A|nr:glycosyltransferase [Streptomyces sp. yr375]SES29055.1 Glycosyltransferase involved in cell wall bisynthesis [Streptomyces sp. yr375]
MLQPLLRHPRHLPVLRRRPRLPLVTYTHATHWDPTDLFRVERYPRLRWADLGNLLAADRVLLVSEYLHRTLLTSVTEAGPVAARELSARLRPVGLPLDLDRIDAARPPGLDGTGRHARDGDAVTVVFNHAPIPAKRPELFVAADDEVLRRTSARIVVTRHFPADAPAGPALRELARRYPGRVTLGEDLPLDDYFRTLWRSDIQVSTALHESLGVATLEAMATGTCPLLPATGAYPEIADGDPDVLYDRPEDVADRLCALVANPARRRRTAHRHSARTRATYAPERVAGAVRKVLAEVLAEVVGAGVGTGPGSTGESPG